MATIMNVINICNKFDTSDCLTFSGFLNREIESEAYIKMSGLKIERKC